MERDVLLARGVRLEDYRFDFSSQPFAARDHREPVLPGSARPEPEEAGRDDPLQPSRSIRRSSSRASSLPWPRTPSISGLTPDSRHFTVAYDKFKLRGLRAFGGAGDAARRHADDADASTRACAPRAAATTRRIACRPSSRFPAGRACASRTPDDRGRQRALRARADAAGRPARRRSPSARSPAGRGRLLPERHPQAAGRRLAIRTTGATRARSARTSSDVSHAVPLTYVPSDEGGGTSHGFKFRAPVGRYLHVMVKDGVQGIGGYLSGKPFVATVKVEPYPQSADVPRRGRAAVAVRRSPGRLPRPRRRARRGRDRRACCRTSCSTSRRRCGDFSRPSLYGDIEDKLVERFIADARLHAARRRASRSTTASTSASTCRTRRRRGAGSSCCTSACARPHADLAEAGATAKTRAKASTTATTGASIEDTRLILVTDLGFIVKQPRTAAATSSCSRSAPACRWPGARVESSASTVAGARGDDRRDRPGAAARPAATCDARRRPLLIVVQKDGDLSFLPFGAGGRELDLSRFDTGGVENAAVGRSSCRAYLFSDRGIYRPGETAHLGMIVRTADWKASLAGLPDGRRDQRSARPWS